MILPVFFFLYESLKSQRHSLLLIEVAAVPLARDLETLLHAKWWPNLRGQVREFQARQRLAGGDAWLCLLLALGFAAFFPHSSTARHIEVGKGVTPRLLDFMREHPDRFQRPLVTTWNAGPLLWNLRPDFRTSFDDRGDFYGDDVVFSFIDLGNGRPGWREKLEKDRFDSAVLDNYLVLNQLLHLTPDWHEVYHDAKTTVYWKTKPQATP
jgi:hypothetical protein